MGATLEVREPSARYLTDLQPVVLRQFELLATASEGVANLRELILTLAVKGKLVQQDANDEPASRLLERVANEKRRLQQRTRTVESISEGEQPFDLPPSWIWARLPEVCHDFGQGVPTEEFTYIDVGAIDNARATITDAVQILRAADAPSRARKLVQQGTVLYSTVRPYLKNIAIVDKAYTPKAIASTAFAVLHPHVGVDGRYLLYYLRSNVFTRFVSSKMVGVAYPAINDTNFFEGIVPLPPSAEQTRIVARVDELMRLCDALEAKGRLEAEQHARLLSTLLGTLTDSRSPEELAANWQRVAAHFDLLLDRPEAVDEIERAVLHLAFEGRLTGAERGNAQVRPSGDVVEYLNGYAFKSDWFLPSGVRLARNVNVAHGHLDWTQRACVATDIAEQFSRFALTEGDILVSLDRPLISTGLKYAVVRQTDLPCLLLQRVALLKPKEEFVLPRYVELWLTSPQFINSIDPGRSNGVPHISTRQLQAIQIRVPALAEQACIVECVAQLRRLCTDLRQRLATGRATQARLADALIDSAVG